MRIAVIGSGLAGLAACFELTSRAEVCLFDQTGIGAGASGIASGLLHGFGGAKARKNRFSSEGLAATMALLEAASEAVGARVYRKDGILRLPQSPEQQLDFERAARDNSELAWWPKERCQEHLPGSLAGPGLFISNGVTVSMKDYLEGVFQICQKRGMEYQTRHIASLDELGAFERIVVATGDSPKPLPLLGIRRLKGQVLKVAWPSNLDAPLLSVIAERTLVMDKERTTCLVGATFEREFPTDGPDLKVAKQELLPGIANLYPQLFDAEILECQAGIRATTPTRLPELQQISERIFVLRGLGSKGLLYHALYAQRLAVQLGFL